MNTHNRKTIGKKISPFHHRRDMHPALFTLKKILAFWFCYIAGLFLAEGAAILLHFAAGKNMLVGDVFDSQTITLIIYYGYLVVIGVVLLYWKWVEKKPLSEMGLTKHLSSYFFGMILALFMLSTSVGIIVLTDNMKYSGILKNIDIPVILLFGGGFMVQGAMEEFLCRGLLFHTLKEKIPLSGAVAVSTIMFIIPHGSSLFAGKALYGIIGIVNLILISIIFSVLTLRFQNIWAACGLHSFWNFILYNVLGLNLSGNDGSVTAIFHLQSIEETIWNGGIYGIEASVITTIVLGIVTSVLLLRHSLSNT